jgi:hypothetical protein
MKNKNYLIKFISIGHGTITTWLHNKTEVYKEWKRLIQLSSKEIEKEGNWNEDIHLHYMVIEDNEGNWIEEHIF